MIRFWRNRKEQGKVEETKSEVRRIINVPHEKNEKGEVIEAKMDDIVHTSILRPGESIKIHYKGRESKNNKE